jgi:hypothetical protein
MVREGRRFCLSYPSHRNAKFSASRARLPLLFVFDTRTQSILLLSVGCEQIKHLTCLSNLSVREGGDTSAMEASRVACRDQAVASIPSVSME